MTIPEEKRAGYISLKEASERFGYSQDYLGQLIRKGKLDGKLVYSHVAWVTTPEAVAQYISDSKNKKFKSTGKEVLATSGSESSVPEVGDIRYVEDTHEDAPSSPSTKWLIILFRVLLFTTIIFAIFVFYLLTTAFGEEVQAGSRAAHASKTFSLALHADHHD